MKILIDARLYGLENAGLGRYITNLVSELSKLDKKNSYTVLLRKKYYQSLNLPENWTKISANFRHYSFSEQFKLLFILNKQRPDLVHFPHFNVPIFFSGNYIVTIHDMLMHVQKGLEATTLPAPLYAIKRLGYRIAFDRAVYGSKAIIVPSEAVKKDILNHYKVPGRKISVTYEGVDAKLGFDGYSEIDSPYFVYSGNAYPHKNLSRLIEAIKLLNKNIDQKVILAIASARNIFTQRLSRKVRKEGAEDFVKLLGFVPDNQLGTLYKNSLGFVTASLSEGFGLPGLEAMSAGTLLLASDIPVYKEVYKSHALYFNPLDFSSIEKTMRETLGFGPEKRKELIKSGIEFAKKYSWNKMAEETLRIYEKSCDSIRQGQ